MGGSSQRWWMISWFVFFVPVAKHPLDPTKRWCRCECSRNFFVRGCPLHVFQGTTGCFSFLFFYGDKSSYCNDIYSRFGFIAVLVVFHEQYIEVALNDFSQIWPKSSSGNGILQITMTFCILPWSKRDWENSHDLVESNHICLLYPIGTPPTGLGKRATTHDRQQQHQPTTPSNNPPKKGEWNEWWCPSLY